MRISVFVDGHEGTTGLEIIDLLSQRPDIEVLPVDSERRKDPDYRRSQYELADLVVLCLPDIAAREAIGLSESVRLIDASTAHRTDPNWVYGLPELSTNQRKVIAQAQYVSNPGCYPTGFLLAIKPLIEDGLVATDDSLQIHAVSGYSGGGKKLISAYKDHGEELLDTRPYALELQHKHLPEMQCYAGLDRKPFFLPEVGPFYRGMIVKLALPRVSIEQVIQSWHLRYEHEPFVNVIDVQEEDTLEDGFLSAMRCNHTNRVDLLTTSNDDFTLVCAILDNLGKGASQAAMQNLNLMLGIEETKGLVATL